MALKIDAIWLVAATPAAATNRYDWLKSEIRIKFRAHLPIIIITGNKSQNSRSFKKTQLFVLWFVGVQSTEQITEKMTTPYTSILHFFLVHSNKKCILLTRGSAFPGSCLKKWIASLPRDFVTRTRAIQISDLARKNAFLPLVRVTTILQFLSRCWPSRNALQKAKSVH